MGRWRERRCDCLGALAIGLLLVLAHAIPGGANPHNSLDLLEKLAKSLAHIPAETHDRPHRVPLVY
ncbi:hypothetical protein B2G71_07840 [Novosphingobium sp. PC22D]|nr:hypothetical protein B2G71_07840 [Novosphingobium sp. PC22D]